MQTGGAGTRVGFMHRQGTARGPSTLAADDRSLPVRRSRLAARSAWVLLGLVPELFGAALANPLVPLLDSCAHEIAINPNRVPSPAVVVATVQEGPRFLVVTHQHALDTRSDVVPTHGSVIVWSVAQYALTDQVMRGASKPRRSPHGLHRLATL
jgi:hypothetical protein|eukprot:COSAG01_NODE_899_length_12871_cov_27.629572_7_plen_154_part_00